MPMMNRMLNGIYPPEPESMSDLTRTLIGIQMRREEKARQAKLDALFEERQRQMMQMAQDEQQAKAADILASIAAVGNRPQIDKQVATAGLTDTPSPAPMVQPAMSPEKQMLQNSTGEPTPPMPPEQADLPMTDPQGVPSSIPLTVKEQSPTPTHEFQFGGMTIKRPLYDRGEMIARSDEASQRALDWEVKKQKAVDEATKQWEVPKGQGFGKMEGVRIPESALPAFFREYGVNKWKENVQPVSGGYLQLDPETGTATFHRTQVPAGAAGALDEEDAASIADGWAEGRAFPSTQAATTKAMRYMDEHPEKYPNKPRKLGFAQQQDVTRATDTLATISDVRNAYEKVKSKIGPITYTFNEYMRKTPGIASDPDFVTFNTLLRGMGNLEIKRITGAQMSEQEAGRLLKGMATGGMKPGDFEAALAVMERNATRNRDVTLYGKVLATPTPASALTPPPDLSPAALAVWKKAMGVK